MPELPDVTLYIDALGREIGGRTIDRTELRSPFFVRSFDPGLEAAHGRVVRGFRRIGKRIVWELEGELFLVFHLMIAGRYHWRKPGSKPRGRIDLAGFHFEQGVLMVTEAGSKKRASLHVVQGEAGLADHDPGGLEVLDAGEKEFRQALLSENHTLKRSLTDPRLFSGIGNAYSDEILHAARLSPVKWTSRLTGEEIARLHEASRSTLALWIERLRANAGRASPGRSPPSARAWPPTAATGSPARSAGPGSSVSSTQPTRPTTARAARQGEDPRRPPVVEAAQAGLAAHGRRAGEPPGVRGLTDRPEKAPSPAIATDSRAH